MARKFLYVIAGLVVLVMVVLVVLNIWAKDLTRMAFAPSVPFQSAAPLAGNAYQDPAMWISRPGKGPTDPALWTPPGYTRPASPGSRAAVFFIHPTSYFGRDHWNAPPTDADANARAELFVKGMASPFGGAAEVWAPRYRQATFGAFLVDGEDGQRALDLAYGDVRAAFDLFLASVPQDAPIVLAGHSQGAALLMRLMQDRVAGKPLASRIVAAYPVGWPISTTHDLPRMGLPACATPDQAGCVMGWGSWAEPAEPEKLSAGSIATLGLDGQPRAGSPLLCSNPLTGQAGGSAPASANLGTLVPTADLSSGTLTPGAVPARCDERGLLLIGDPPQMGSYVMPGNNYHVYDIPLFWANVAADFARREAAWTKSAGSKAPIR